MCLLLPPCVLMRVLLGPWLVFGIVHSSSVSVQKAPSCMWGLNLILRQGCSLITAAGR